MEAALPSLKPSLIYPRNRHGNSRLQGSRSALSNLKVFLPKLTLRVELGDTSSLHNLPLSLLHAELQRRQDKDYKPSCGTSGERGTYNLPLHVFALFLILILSTLGLCVSCSKCFCGAN
jgi:hypothetical protein